MRYVSPKRHRNRHSSYQYLFVLMLRHCVQEGTDCQVSEETAKWGWAALRRKCAVPQAAGPTRIVIYKRNVLQGTRAAVILSSYSPYFGSQACLPPAQNSCSSMADVPVSFIPHDNTRAHTAVAVNDRSPFLHWLSEILEHPPYSPDMSPCGYDLFIKWKNHCEGHVTTQKRRLLMLLGGGAGHSQKWTRW
jgi:hypothetical protein